MTVFRCEICDKHWKEIHGTGGWILHGHPERRSICPEHPRPTDEDSILAEAAPDEPFKEFLVAFLKGERDADQRPDPPPDPTSASGVLAGTLSVWRSAGKPDRPGTVGWWLEWRRWRRALRNARQTCSVSASTGALAVALGSGVPRRAGLAAELYGCISIAAALAAANGNDYASLSLERRHVYVKRAVSTEAADPLLAAAVADFRRSAMTLSRLTELGAQEPRRRTVDELHLSGEKLHRAAAAPYRRI